MTEEIMIGKKDVVACNYWEACDYYKQLKRLKQENFALTQEGQQKSQTICELAQENKELKEKKDKYYQQTLDDEILMNELSLEVDLRKKESDFYLEKLSKYRSALEEINILAKNYCNACDEFKVKTYKNKNDCLYCNYGFIKRKINEILN